MYVYMLYMCKFSLGLSISLHLRLSVSFYSGVSYPTILFPDIYFHSKTFPLLLANSPLSSVLLLSSCSCSLGSKIYDPFFNTWSSFWCVIFPCFLIRYGNSLITLFPSHNIYCFVYCSDLCFKIFTSLHRTKNTIYIVFPTV